MDDASRSIVILTFWGAVIVLVIAGIVAGFMSDFGMIGGR
jgi:hypothetical protein